MHQSTQFLSVYEYFTNTDYGYRTSQLHQFKGYRTLARQRENFIWIHANS